MPQILQAETAERFFQSTAKAHDLEFLTHHARQRQLSCLGAERQARQLTLPGMMGEKFQVMGLGRGLDQPLRGFSLQDLRHRL